MEIITLLETKNHLGLDSTYDDAVLAQYILSATDFVEKATHYPITPKDGVYLGSNIQAGSSELASAYVTPGTVEAKIFETERGRDTDSGGSDLNTDQYYLRFHHSEYWSRPRVQVVWLKNLSGYVRMTYTYEIDRLQHIWKAAALLFVEALYAEDSERGSRAASAARIVMSTSRSISCSATNSYL